MISSPSKSSGREGGGGGGERVGGEGAEEADDEDRREGLITRSDPVSNTGFQHSRVGDECN